MLRTLFLSMSGLALLAVATVASGEPAASPGLAGPSGNAGKHVDSLEYFVTKISTENNLNMMAFAYGRGSVLFSQSAELHNAYMRGLLRLGQIEMAYLPARRLEPLDPANGLAWAVRAHMHASGERFDEAFTAAVRAAVLERSHPFVLDVAGQMAAWRDHQGEGDSSSPAWIALEAMREDLAKHPAYAKAYADAKAALESQDRPAPADEDKTPEPTEQVTTKTEYRTVETQPVYVERYGYGGYPYYYYSRYPLGYYLIDGHHHGRSLFHHRRGHLRGRGRRRLGANRASRGRRGLGDGVASRRDGGRRRPSSSLFTGNTGRPSTGRTLGSNRLRGSSDRRGGRISRLTSGGSRFRISFGRSRGRSVGRVGAGNSLRGGGERFRSSSERFGGRSFRSTGRSSGRSFRSSRSSGRSFRGVRGVSRGGRRGGTGRGGRSRGGGRGAGGRGGGRGGRGR